MLSLSSNDLRELTAWRHKLHQQPEISGNEVRTAAEVADYLARTKPDDVITEIGGAGLAIVYNGSAPGPTILLRAELDALPIEERTSKPYRSAETGKAHLCGHDGHMASLAAIAYLLGRRRPRSGRVVLLFQPAEETGVGAAAVITDPKFAAITPQMAFAYHNLPGLPLGHALLAAGCVCCASVGLRIQLTGSTSHASSPEDAISPIHALSRLMLLLNALGSGQVTDPDFTLATVTHVNMGDPTFGITPGNGVLFVTLRASANEKLAQLSATASKMAQQIAREYGLHIEISEHEAFDACMNAPEAVTCLAAALAVEKVPCKAAGLPVRFSEDFGRFGRTIPSAILFLGSGEFSPNLHSPSYDFPDTLIAIAARIFSRLIFNLLK